MGAGASSQLPLKKIKKRVSWKLSQFAPGLKIDLKYAAAPGRKSAWRCLNKDTPCKSRQQANGAAAPPPTPLNTEKKIHNILRRASYIGTPTP